MTNPDPIVDALKEAGFSVTAPRRAVFEAIRELGPATPAEIAERVATQADRASTYRTIALFRKIGFIRDVTAGWKQMVELGDRFDPHHHHITCSQCGRTATLENAAIERRLVELAAARGYALESHQLELSGLCGDCRAKA